MKIWKMLFSCLLVPGFVFAQEPDPSWDSVTKAVWISFKRTPHMIDNCALKIAHGIEIDKNRGWPAYCNNFEETSVVSQRVSELKEMIQNLRVPEQDLEKLSAGEIWVGAPGKYAELSWGRPKDVNRTITSNRTLEQWVYQGGYLYIENGKVVSIQN